jgi:predicted nucleic acid-binding protein
MGVRKDPPYHPSVLIDPPLWQSYFHKEELSFQEGNALMDAGRGGCLGLIVGELLHAAKSEGKIRVLQDLTRVFPIPPESPEPWVHATHLAFQLRQRGKKICLREGYLAHMAQTHGVLLYTRNKALRRAQRTIGGKLKFYPDRRISE